MEYDIQAGDELLVVTNVLSDFNYKIGDIKTVARIVNKGDYGTLVTTDNHTWGLFRLNPNDTKQFTFIKATKAAKVLYARN